MQPKFLIFVMFTSMEWHQVFCSNRKCNKKKKITLNPIPKRSQELFFTNNQFQIFSFIE